MDKKKYKGIIIDFDDEHLMSDTIDYVSLLVEDGAISGTDPNWKLIKADEEPLGLPVTDKLEKPDLTKPAFQLFPQSNKAILETKCTICGNEINAGPGPTEFRNKLSMTEYRISGMCQKCQDKTYGLD